MRKHNLQKFAQTVQLKLTEHSPEILTALGIAGLWTAGILSVRATLRARNVIEQERKLREKERERSTDEQPAVEEISKKDVVKLCWKYYVPPVAMGVVSTGCLIGANSVNARRNAALATAYTLSETALREYQEKVVETIGEKKEEAIRDSVIKDKMDRSPINDREIIITGSGDTTCYDIHSDRYFKSDIEKLRRAANDLNRQMLSDMYVSLNDFYDEIGLSPTSMGNILGWNVDRGLIDLRFSSHLASNGTPCLAIDYVIAPDYGFNKLI